MKFLQRTDVRSFAATSYRVLTISVRLRATGDHFYVWWCFLQENLSNTFNHNSCGTNRRSKVFFLLSSLLRIFVFALIVCFHNSSLTSFMPNILWSTNADPGGTVELYPTKLQYTSFVACFQSSWALIRYICAQCLPAFFSASLSSLWPGNFRR